jgi:glucose dehydrogenase
MATASGLTFVAANQDGRFRAIESRTGKLLWQTTLPASGLSTPITYKQPGGRQFVIGLAGGNPVIGTPRRPDNSLCRAIRRLERGTICKTLPVFAQA